MLDPRLRGLLVCPSCRGELDEAPDHLRCAAEDLSFPVVDGVPYLVLELAQRGRRRRGAEPPEEHVEPADAPPAADPHNA